MTTPPPYTQQPEQKTARISVDMLMQALHGAWARFPVTVVFIFLLTFWSVLFAQNSEYFYKEMSENVMGALWYFCSVGIVLSLAVSLWCECIERSVRVAMTVAIVLLLADTIYLMMCASELSVFWTIGHIAIVTSLSVAIVFMPSRDSWVWNFADAQVGAVLTALFFACGFSIAVGIIFGTISALFGIESFGSLVSIQTVAAGTVPAIIFLHLIPRKSEIQAKEHSFAASKFQCGTAKYFFLMLTAVYMCILYIYGFKILFTWELPRGVVSLSVTGLTVAMLLTMFLLEGVRRTHPEDLMTHRALRLLPVAMIPLFVLMSVGVLYRIGQYGLTVSRLYVLTFNIWCYAVAIYLILSKVRRYNFVAISFAVVFLATSIFPYFNYTTLTDRIMRHELKEALVAIGFTEFPVKESEFVKVYNKLPKRQKIDIESKIKYLDSKKDHSLLSDITEATYYSDKESEYISGYFLYTKYDYDDCDAIEVDVPRRSFATESQYIHVPEGYSSVLYQKWCGYNTTFNDVEGFVTIGNVSFDVPVDSLMALDPSVNFEAVTLRPRSGCTDTLFIARTIDLNWDRDDWNENRKTRQLEITGYIITK